MPASSMTTTLVGPTADGASPTTVPPPLRQAVARARIAVVLPNPAGAIANWRRAPLVAISRTSATCPGLSGVRFVTASMRATSTAGVGTCATARASTTNPAPWPNNAPSGGPRPASGHGRELHGHASGSHAGRPRTTAERSSCSRTFGRFWVKSLRSCRDASSGLSQARSQHTRASLLWMSSSPAPKAVPFWSRRSKRAASASTSKRPQLW